MPYFEISYEGKGFTSQDTTTCGLSELFLKGYSESKAGHDGLLEKFQAITKGAH